jgi:hypothetical protein
VLVGVGVWEGWEEPRDLGRGDLLQVVEGGGPGALLLHREVWQGVGEWQVLLRLRLQQWGSRQAYLLRRKGTHLRRGAADTMRPHTCS